MMRARRVSASASARLEREGWEVPLPQQRKDIGYVQDEIESVCEEGVGGGQVEVEVRVAD